MESITVKLPPGFDPSKHGRALVTSIAEAHGPGWEIGSIDVSKGTAVAFRQGEIAEVLQDGEGSSGKRTAMQVKLPRGTKPTDGDKFAERMTDTYPGYHLIRFSPFLGTAVLAQLSDDEVRCRSAVAVAIGAKPWDVQVRKRKDGGYRLVLPKTYMPSKHFDKLVEVAQAVVGSPGWYVLVDAQKLTADMVPSDPPTFPPVIPYPLHLLGKGDSQVMRIGRALGKDGKNGDEVEVRFADSPHLQLSGTSGSGKSVVLNQMIAHQLASGAELVIVDLPHKAIDFTWCKPYVRDGGWGCESLAAAVAAVSMVYDEGMRRARLLKDHDVQKVSDLPARLQPPPVFIVFDEVTGLVQNDPVPAGIPKSHPLVQKAIATNLLRQTLLDFMKRISAELRFVGFRMVLSSQVSNSTTGIPPALKTNLGNKMLQGSNPTKANRGFALLDPTRVPEVPEWVKSDGAANRGVGVAELEGQEPVVYKSYFATPAQFTEVLERLGVRRTSRPDPTPEEVAAHTPSLDDTGDGFDDTPAPVRVGDVGPVTVLDDDGRPLKGAAAAARASKQLAAGPPCPSCGKPISPDGTCGCSW